MRHAGPVGRPPGPTAAALRVPQPAARAVSPGFRVLTYNILADQVRHGAQRFWVPVGLDCRLPCYEADPDGIAHKPATCPRTTEWPSSASLTDGPIARSRCTPSWLLKRANGICTRPGFRMPSGCRHNSDVLQAAASPKGMSCWSMMGWHVLCVALLAQLLPLLLAPAWLLC